MPRARAALPAALLDRLAAVPYAPRDVWRDPRHYYSVVKGGLDFVAHNLPRWNAILGRVNPYPKPWERVRVPVDGDGTTLGAWYGPGEPGAPALLYAPGTFQTKDDTPRKAHAIRARREWGYHVLVVDLRGFGDSHATLGTGGWQEAHDLHRAADLLRERSGARRVALVGDSLGGASALIAGALPGARERFSGVVAWSPFADLGEQVEYSSRKPPVRDPYYVPFVLYRFMLRLRTNGELTSFRDFVEHRARDLGVPPHEFLRRSSPASYVGRVEVPALVVHAEDDPIVPVEQARVLAAAARDNPCVHVRVLPKGGHVGFYATSPDWYWETMRVFLEHLRADDDASEAADAAGEVAARASAEEVGAA